MKANQKLNNKEQLNNKEDSIEKLQYYTTLYKFPKYLEKVNILYIIYLKILILVYFLFKYNSI